MQRRTRALWCPLQVQMPMLVVTRNLNLNLRFWQAYQEKVFSVGQFGHPVRLPRVNAITQLRLESRVTLQRPC